MRRQPWRVWLATSILVGGSVWSQAFAQQVSPLLQGLPDPRKDPQGYSRELAKRVGQNTAEVQRQLQILNQIQNGTAPHINPQFQMVPNRSLGRPVNSYGYPSGAALSRPAARPNSQPAAHISPPAKAKPPAPAQPTAAISPPPASEPPVERKPVRPQVTFEGKILNEKQQEALNLATDTTFIAQCQWQQADEQLQKAIALYPELYLAHSNRAYVLKKLGHLDEALKEAQKARELSSKTAEPILMIASIYQVSGNIDEALKEYQTLLSQFPKHPLSAVIRGLVERLQVESATQKAVGKLLKKGGQHDDYFEYVTYDTLTKWQPKKFPLKVYLPNSDEVSRIAGYKPEFGAALRDSFLNWNNTTEGTVNFEIVSAREGADIECQWTSNAKMLSNPAEAGETRSRFDLEKGMLKAKIIILTVAPGVPSVSATDIKRTALHEIGHSLGLMGHSPAAEDIMYFSVSDKQSTLTPRDIKTMMHLYSRDVKLANSDRDRIREPIVSGNSMAINDQGTKLLAENKLDAANEKFLEALKINPDCEAAKQNLAQCQSAIATESEKKGDLAKAISGYQQALALMGDNADKAEKSSILKSLAEACDKCDKSKEAQKYRADAANNTVSVARTTESYVLFGVPRASAQNMFQLGIQKRSDIAEEDINFGPYMADLQRRIKKAWFPPRGNESKRVQVQFKIHSGGELSNLRISTSSGLAIADHAAFNAVQNAAPFRPLPEGAPGDVDIQFTFDYNVFNGGGKSVFKKF